MVTYYSHAIMIKGEHVAMEQQRTKYHSMALFLFVIVQNTLDEIDILYNYSDCKTSDEKWN